MNFRFPEEGRFQQEEERFEENLFESQDGGKVSEDAALSSVGRTESPDFASDPSFTPERVGPDLEEYTTQQTQVRDRGLTHRDGVEQEFDRKIYADTSATGGWNQPLGLSVQVRSSQPFV